MSAIDRDQTWTRGDPVSRSLLDLAADRGLPPGTRISTGLVELAQRHGLIGILADHTKDRLTRAVFARDSARRAVLRKHLNRVLTRLHDANVRAAVVKGPAIAGHYREREHRPFSDLDLLVPETRLDAALAVLGNDEATVRVPAKRPKADKRDILFRDASGVRFSVDLHWDLFSYSQLRGAAEGATEAAWEQAEPNLQSPLGPVWEIPEPYRVAFLAAHAVLDHRFRLILFRDFLELARRGIDFPKLEYIASQWGLGSTTFLALWISRGALGVAVPEEFFKSVYQK